MAWITVFFSAQAQEEPVPPDPTPVLQETIPLLPVTFKNWEDYPPRVQKIVIRAFSIDAQQLGYVFGSADPARGGMDCSGSVQHLLKTTGHQNVPRQSDAFYRWAWLAGTFTAVNGTTFKSFEWHRLRPGDLLFWTGTYAVDPAREPAISHVMIYLGEEEASGRKLMFGASEGRRYGGNVKNGVGIFDFELPRPKAGSALRARFVGYATIPPAATVP